MRVPIIALHGEGTGIAESIKESTDVSNRLYDNVRDIHMNGMHADTVDVLLKFSEDGDPRLFTHSWSQLRLYTWGFVSQASTVPGMITSVLSGFRARPLSQSQSYRLPPHI